MIFMLLTFFVAVLAYSSGVKITGYLVSDTHANCEPVDYSSCEFKVEQLVACYKGCQFSHKWAGYDSCIERCSDFYTVEFDDSGECVNG